MATLANLRAAVATKLGLDNSTAGDQGNIDNWVNEGFIDVLTRTRCATSTASLSLTSGTADYALSACTTLSALDFQGLVFNNAGSPVAYRRTTPENIIRLRTDIGASSASGVRFFAVAGAPMQGVLMFYPTPGAADIVHTYYVAKPAALSLSADIPTACPSQWHKAIELYACWQAADYDDDKSSDVGDTYRKMYLEYINSIKQQLDFEGSIRFDQPIVGPRRRGVRPTAGEKPDVY